MQVAFQNFKSSILGCAFIVLICLSCGMYDAPSGTYTDYFPPISLLQSGVVNKYYVHTHIAGEQDTSTHIYYRAYQLKGDDLVINNYVDVFTKQLEKKLELSNDQFISKQRTRIYQSIGAIHSTIHDSISIDWVNQDAKEKSIEHFSWGSIITENHQISNKDSTYLDLSSKVFLSKGTIVQQQEQETSSHNYTYKNIYTEGLGLTRTEFRIENQSSWHELVEQIHLDDFLATREENLNLIGYIDTLQSLDIDKPFPMCLLRDNIYQYYVDGKSIHYLDGKSGIWKIINENLDTTKLFEESGYLTFRFIINCEGRAGRHVTEEADLDFQPKQFSQETKDHFYSILQKMDNWFPTEYEGERVDAYSYLTFKLEDGELIEILP